MKKESIKKAKGYIYFKPDDIPDLPGKPITLEQGEKELQKAIVYLKKIIESCDKQLKN